MASGSGESSMIAARVCGGRLAAERPGGPWRARRGSRRTRTGPSGSRRAGRAPAPATCSPRCRAPRRPPCAARAARARSAGLESNHCSPAAAGPRARSFARPKSRIFTKPSPVDHHVLGLEVAVDDAGGVRLARPSATCAAISSSRRVRARPALLGEQQLAQRLPVDELHHDEGQARALRRSRGS